MKPRRARRWLGWILPLGGLLAACHGRGASAAREEAYAAEVAPVVFHSDSLGMEVRDIALGTDIWAVNRGEPSVARYGRDGRLLWRGVTRGEGPDQVRTTWSVVAAGDTAFAWDPESRWLLRIVDGQVARVATLEFASTHTVSWSTVYGSPGRLRRWSGGWVTYATDSAQWHPKALTRMVILRFDGGGRLIDTLANLRPQGVQVLMDERVMAAADLVPVPLWDMCPGDRFVLFNPNTQRLIWRDLGISHGDSLFLAFTPEEMPEALQRAYLLETLRKGSLGRIPEDRLKADVDRGFDAERYTFGQETFYATTLFCDAGGRVWIQRFSVDAPPRGFGSTWEVVDLAAKTTVTVRLPRGFHAMAADSSLVYGAVEDDDGIQSIATLPRTVVLQASQSIP